MATILASVLATGTLAFAADDRDPEDNQIDHDVVQDVARLLGFTARLAEAQQAMTTIEQAQTIAEQHAPEMNALYNEIGGQRFSCAISALLFMVQALDEARVFGAQFIKHLADVTDMPGPKKWMARYGADHGLLAPTGEEIPEAIKQMAAQLRAKGMVVDIEHVSRAVTGRVHDKPIGTGPNGEKH